MTWDISYKDVIGTICMVVGIVVLVVGAMLGWKTPRVMPTKDAKAVLEAALKAIDEATTATDHSRTLLRAAPEGPGAAHQVTQAADSATAKAKEATETTKSALQQVEGIIGSLPENLRFAGLLVMVGTVLIGVATIQFGGTSLF